MKNILFLSAGRRVELVRSFYNEIIKKYRDIKIFATDFKPQFSSACQITNAFIEAPRVTDDNYLDFLLQTCDDYNIGIVIPTIDTELLLLSENRDYFFRKGINLIISEEKLVKKCRDKRLTALLFQKIGIDTPVIYNSSNIVFPCFAKPYDGSCSVGAFIIKNEEMLTDSIIADKKIMLMEFIDSSYKEFTVDAYYNRQGELKCLVPRQRIEVRGGEVSKAITKKHFLYEELLPKLIFLEGARGCLTFQFFVNEKTRRIVAIEINPRFGGGFPLSYSAGANYPGWLIDEYFFDKAIPFFDGWESALLMLRYDANVLVHNASSS